MPFDYEEVTFDIVLACEEHFWKKVDKDMVCDILVGEHGPSCKTVANSRLKSVLHAIYKERENTYRYKRG